jgi:O-antigen/teichoic acid export membrane protein
MIRKNILYLGITQVISIVVPLALFPYLTRTLESEQFGLYVWLIAVSQYAIIFSEWGFNLSASRDVSLNKNNSNYISDKYATITILKIMLFVIASLVTLIIVYMRDRSNLQLMILCLLTALFQIITPNWLIQGLEKFKIITLTTIVARIISVPLTLYLVKTNKDIYWALLVNVIVAGIICIGATIGIRKYIRTIKTKFEDISEALKSGKTIFISTVATNIYTQTIIIVLGFTSSHTEVATFAIADKLKQAMLLPFNPIFQGSYPRLVEQFKKSMDDGIKIIRKLIKLILIYSSVIIILVQLFGEKIVEIIFEKSYFGALESFKVLSFMTVVTGISGVIGILCFTAIGKQKETLRAILFGAISAILLVYPLTLNFGNVGASWSILISEIIITTVMIIRLPKILKK